MAALEQLTSRHGTFFVTGNHEYYSGVRSWVAENVLNEQPFVKDETRTIGQLLGGANLKLTKFVRLRVGEVTG